MPGSRKNKPIKLLRKRLDDAGVQAHLAELARDAREIEIRVKDAADSYSSATAEQLEETGRRLCAGNIAAVQIRFCQDDQWWCDTIMRVREDYRLVRMRQGDI